MASEYGDGTITLPGDVELSEPMTTACNLTVDLAGYMLTCTITGTALTTSLYDILTVTDSAPETTTEE